MLMLRAYPVVCLFGRPRSAEEADRQGVKLTGRQFQAVQGGMPCEADPVKTVRS